ncbi:riboflavin kinase [Whalleya microplaca]|nr:riboflavin kinase [Whalleya microplaca]
MSTERPRILYPDSGPEAPFPLHMEGTVISGFGRGSKELGIPTANLPVDETATPWIASAKSGVYFGYASLLLPTTHADYPASADASTTNAPQPNGPSSSSTSTSTTTTTTTNSTSTTDGDNSQSQSPPKSKWLIYPMVMSIGYNPFYKNAVRSAEVHVLRRFGADFYGAPMRLLILGFVRDELDYAGRDALIRDINIDCDVARQSLARPAWIPRQGTAVEDGGGATTGGLDGSWLVREA